MKRYFVLGVVWLGCALGWMLLGATLLVRSGETSSQLLNEVHALWGPPLDQGAPAASYLEPRSREERTTLYAANGRPYESTVTRTEEVSLPLPRSPPRPGRCWCWSIGRRDCSGSPPTRWTSRPGT